MTFRYKLESLSLANIRLGWKGLPRTNDLAYYEKAELTTVKSFITLAPRQISWPEFDQKISRKIL
jgi:hypothetical protein